MKIAVTYENGEIFQHFGHSEAFKFYNIEDGKISSSEILSTNGSGHGALASFLKNRNVNILICGGIGGGAKTALTEAGIKLYGGVSGSADTAVNELLSNSLTYSSEANCDHHDSKDHAECGDNGCGNCGNH